MRFLLLSFFVFAVSIGFSQNDTPASDSNADSLKERKEASPKGKLAADSISTLKLDKDYKNTPQKKSKVAEDVKREVMDIAPAAGSVSSPESEEDNAGYNQSYRSAVQTFEYTKKQSTNQRMQRSPSTAQQSEMKETVDFFENKSPNSFEYHYFKFVAGNYDVSLFNHLKQAEKIRSENADVHVQMAAYYMIKGDQPHANEYINKLISSKRLSGNVIKYAEDILISVPQNGTLITHGFDDTYAVWYVQNEKKMRTDVKLISLDFMQSDYYKAELKKSGFTLPSSSKIDVNYFTQFCQSNSLKNICISLTTPKEYFKNILPNVYVVGLVFEYHKNTFDNFKSNEKLWNQSLKKHLVNNAQDEKAKQLSSNYLPMLFQLRKVYHQNGKNDKVAEIDKTVDKISAQCKKYDQVQKLKKAY